MLRREGGKGDVVAFLGAPERIRVNIWFLWYYFGDPSENGERVWLDNRSARRKLPKPIGVQLSVINKDGGQEVWPDIVVATRVRNARREQE